jgi:hypothetical protein
MTDLLRLFMQIALLKRGPQDLPASPVLLAITTLAYFAVTFLVYSVLPETRQPWRPQLVTQVIYILVSLGVVLQLAGRPERYLQTTTAMFGYLAVLSPIMACIGSLIERFQPQPMVQFPFALIGLGLLVWMITIGYQVLKAALEWSTLASIVLVLLWIFTGEVLITFLFPAPPAAEVPAVTPSA